MTPKRYLFHTPQQGRTYADGFTRAGYTIAKHGWGVWYDTVRAKHEAAGAGLLIRGPATSVAQPGSGIMTAADWQRAADANPDQDKTFSTLRELPPNTILHMRGPDSENVAARPWRDVWEDWVEPFAANSIGVAYDTSNMLTPDGRNTFPDSDGLDQTRYARYGLVCACAQALRAAGVNVLCEANGYTAQDHWWLNFGCLARYERWTKPNTRMPYLFTGKALVMFADPEHWINQTPESIVELCKKAARLGEPVGSMYEKPVTPVLRAAALDADGWARVRELMEAQNV